jgi:hypothetical protein
VVLSTLAVASGLFLQTGKISSYLLAELLILFSGLLILSFGINIFTLKKDFQYGQAFFHLNLYFLLVLLLLSLDIFSRIDSCNLGFAEKVCGALDTRRKGEAVY